MKTTLRKLFEEAMQTHGETWDDAVAVNVDADPDAEFDNDFGRMEGGNGTVTTRRAHYSTYSNQGRKEILMSLSHPDVVDAGAEPVDPVAELERLTENFLSAIRENFGDDAYLSVSEAVLAVTKGATDKPDETQDAQTKCKRKKAGDEEPKPE